MATKMIMESKIIFWFQEVYELYDILKWLCFQWFEQKRYEEFQNPDRFKTILPRGGK